MAKQQTLRERIDAGPLVLDGAIGTELYKRGKFVNKPFDDVNRTDGELLLAIHREYVDAGADAIETNTFSANRVKLAKSGLDDAVEDLNRRAVQLARKAAGDSVWVLGSVGPSGVDRSTAAAPAIEEGHAALIEQVGYLLDEEVDGLIFETFGILAELEQVLLTAREMTDLPIFALASFPAQGATVDGVSADEAAQRLAAAGADVIGGNCSDGPLAYFDLLKAMRGHGKPVAVVPNAGYPRLVDGRTIYMATPEYFGVNAKRFFKAGASVVGGCCGTGPEHIRAMKGAAQMQSGGKKENTPKARSIVRVESDHAQPPIPNAQRSTLAQKVESGEGFVVSVEVNPPTGLDATRQIEAARMLRSAGVDVVNIADGPRASCRMSNWSLALQVQRELDMEAIVHFCSRDRNLLGLQSDLLAYHVMGVRNLVIITGDPPKLGDYPHASAVFDLDSIGMIRMAEALNRGLDPAGRPIDKAGAQTSFFISCGAEPAAVQYDREIRRLEEKVEAGATMIMTQPVYDPQVLDRFLNDISHLDAHVLVGLLPLASDRNAEFLHNEVPGMQVPESIRARMSQVGSGPDARREGVRIAQEALLAVKDRVRGAYIMPPFGRYEAAIEILECVGYERPEGWRDNWRE